jgi:hypothetical protein
MSILARALFLIIALGASTLSAGRAATPRTEPDWNAALATLTRLKDHPQDIERERATLDRLAAAILPEASSGEPFAPSPRHGVGTRGAAGNGRV